MTPNYDEAIYTILVAGSAASEYLPPRFLFKGKHLCGLWTVLGSMGATYDGSESMLITHTVFENWFSSSFLSFIVGRRKPVIFTFDGHVFHLTYSTIVKALQRNVIIVWIPPHTSHVLQPLDVTVFKLFKDHWCRILLKFYRETSKVIFPSLIKKLWGKISSDNSVSGFRGAGLWPLYCHAVHEERSIDSETEHLGDT